MATTASTTAPVSLASVTLEVADPEATAAFHRAFGVDAHVRVRAAAAPPADGFRGFTLALTVSGPATVDAFFGAAVDAGATVIKPATKSLWGYGGVVRAPDGTFWKIATSAKKDTGPATREIDEFVLLLGVDDVKATKEFYVGQGLRVAKSFGGKYAEFTPGTAAGTGTGTGTETATGTGTGTGVVKLALYKRRGLAKDLGVTDDGAGAHHVVLGGTGGSFTDLDGFVWEGEK
ncbi:glyoxalase [Streptomyces sp. NPDC088785]|uniref:glyoxalase n=1 Tax=Streptomyces sp. NPDC088785 TaxID=3365897 RepID=UPI00382C844D